MLGKVAGEPESLRVWVNSSECGRAAAEGTLRPGVSTSARRIGSMWCFDVPVEDRLMWRGEIKMPD